MREVMTAGLIGMTATPAQGQAVPPGAHWMADNGCFGGGYPGDQAWLAWLDSYTPEERSRCRFAVAPDVVGDAAATLIRSAPFLHEIRQLGYSAALVAQNRLEDLEVPWVTFDVLFLGGCVECPDHGPTLEPITTGSGGAQRFYCPVCRVQITEWKVGPAARRLADEARAWGKQVHMGRVNSERRFMYAMAIGCDSVDGTFLTFGPDRRLPELLAWGRNVHQLALEGT